MFPSHLYRLLADEREREVQELLRVRALVSGNRRGRAVPASRSPESRAHVTRGGTRP